MDKVMLCPNLNLPTVSECVKNVIYRLKECGIESLMEEKNAAALGCSNDVTIGTEQQLLESCDAAISIGGDGTMFHLARSLMNGDKPILGINSGRLGFLCQLGAADLSVLEKLKTNDFDIENRMVLKFTASGKDSEIVRYAINDVVLSRSHLGRIIDIDVLYEEYQVGEYRADGMIFSTPTGSTAYSLSAGGPIMDPAVDAIVMTPICPHLLAGRSLVFSPDKRITAKTKLPDSSMQLCIAVDGIQEDVTGMDTFLIEKSDKVSRFICFKDRSFYKTLNQKLKLRG